MVLRTRGPRTIFTGHRLLLHVGYGDADKVGVFYGGSECLAPRPGAGTSNYLAWGKTPAAEGAASPGGYLACWVTLLPPCSNTPFLILDKK